jgi:hypothetical protein
MIRWLLIILVVATLGNVAQGLAHCRFSDYANCPGQEADDRTYTEEDQNDKSTTNR